jgi:hypothetical protein
MRKKRTPHRTQPDLFQLPIVTPHWRILPPDVRQRVRALLVELFREARAGHRPSQGKEGGNE